MRYPLAVILSLSSIGSYANVLQYFAGISYSNPAELFKIKKNQLIIGGTGFYGDVRFSGSVLNLNSFQYDSGVSSSRRFSFLPYGRIASRVDEKFVWGVDVTQPFHSNLIYGLNSFTRYAVTETLMTDVDVSPRFSYNIVPRLNFGAGLNFNFLKDNETNWALPTGPTSYAMFINRTSGFGVGYNAGVYFIANPSNFFGATYYSSIKQKTRGESIFNGNVNTNLSFNFSMPATTILTYTHLFNQKWLAGFQTFRSEWNANQYARIRNTAAPPPAGPNFTFTMKYSASWAYSGFVRQQYNENLGLTLIGLIDDGPERDHLRTLNFPSDTQYFLGLASDYQLSKLTTLELLYGHVFSKTTIGNSIIIGGQQLPFTTGRVRINADVFELRLKLQA
ncbi:OmpP1/FadL family transporter [Legionella hackeliae]|uniref:(Outer) membrane protein n=1 Tax=Legionella hackeliae TaxID=449 RepID=A0A0A8UV19_LEGHA|nr:outer membrane protein transport protein [Legionella hackeliae]KTD15266.1 outer membrane protein [Legionella hackeliae]CEK11366.1 (Outer) membrane protein [Legionella hackeliae]STX48139.1 outer membrane protein [Legionella hackeliae]